MKRRACAAGRWSLLSLLLAATVLAPGAGSGATTSIVKSGRYQAAWCAGRIAEDSLNQLAPVGSASTSGYASARTGAVRASTYAREAAPVGAVVPWTPPVGVGPIALVPEGESGLWQAVPGSVPRRVDATVGENRAGPLVLRSVGIQGAVQVCIVAQNVAIPGAGTWAVSAAVEGIDPRRTGSSAGAVGVAGLLSQARSGTEVFLLAAAIPCAQESSCAASAYAQAPCATCSPATITSPGAATPETLTVATEIRASAPGYINVQFAFVTQSWVSGFGYASSESFARLARITVSK